MVVMSGPVTTAIRRPSQPARCPSLAPSRGRALRRALGQSLPGTAGGDQSWAPRRTSLVASSAVNKSLSFSHSGPLGVAQALDAFYRFTRPHTMIGTSLSVTSVSLLAMQGQAWTATAFYALATALLAALLANVSIVGLNQCYDVEIDQLNKPYLPLASGEFSMQTGWAIVLTTGALSLLVSVLSGSLPLIITVSASHLLGIFYSADLAWMRWKRSPLLAAGCILAVRAAFVQIGFWAHMQFMALGYEGPLQLSGSVLFLAGLMTWFSIVIALFKDLPDVVGDKRANIQTATVVHGVEPVFWTCIALLQAAYATAVWYCITHCSGWMRVVTVAGQALFAVLLSRKAKQTDLTSHAQIVDAYMFVWKLFYAQYLLVPFMH